MNRRHPFAGILLRDTCPACDRRLWGMTFIVPNEVGAEGEVTPPRALHVAICGHCDRPTRDAGPVRPRTGIDGPTARYAPPEPWYGRDWFVRLMIFMVALGAVIVAAQNGGGLR